MPRFTDSTALNSQTIGGTNYGFSATRIEDLGATEYTLGLVVVDVSGSTVSDRPGMEKALQEIVKACRQNPRADNMMLRVVLFDHTVTEFHGFKPLPACNDADYANGCLGRTGGSTALYDAAYNAVKSATQYGKDLTAKDFDVNAVVFVITDGENNAGAATRKMVKEALEEGVKGECLESLNSILIGIGGDQNYFKALQTECGFTQFIGLAGADAKTLAKLGDFISKSISSTSQALGTGGPSQSLAF